MKPITLAMAVGFCRLLEKELKEVGYHCGLTGSVLYKGESTKDVDIIIYPHSDEDQRLICDVLFPIAGKLGFWVDVTNLDRYAELSGRIVLNATYRGRRIDFFFFINQVKR